MHVATARLDTFLKMQTKYPACAQKIDYVAINARRTCVHTRHHSAAMCIMLCMNSSACMIGLHEVHSYILVCMSTNV